MSGTVPAGTPVVPLGAPGRQGVQGATGPLGPAGVRPEPTAGINGRQVQPAPARWTPALPLTGGALSGGLDMGATAIPGSALWPFTNDPRVTRHIDLWGGAYGLAVIDALGVTGMHRSAGVHQFWENGNPTFSFRNSGEVWLSQDGWRVSWTWTGTGANVFGSSIYYNPANTPLFGEITGDVDLSGQPDKSWRLVVWGDFYCVHEASSSARGVCFYNVVTPTRFLYITNTQGYIIGMVDRAVSIILANACDERLKRDISPSRYDCLGAIRSVPLYQFRWQDNRLPREPRPAPRAAPVHPVGFVAQRLAERTPDLVAKQRPLPRLSPAEEDPPQAMWSVETNHMLAALVGAVQQLDQKITALEDRRHA